MPNQYGHAAWEDFCFGELIFDGFQTDGTSAGSAAVRTVDPYGMIHWSGAQLVAESRSGGRDWVGPLAAGNQVVNANLMRFQLHGRNLTNDPWTLILPVDGAGLAQATWNVVPRGARTLVFNSARRFLRIQLVTAAGVQTTDPDGLMITIAQLWPISANTEEAYA